MKSKYILIKKNIGLVWKTIYITNNKIQTKKASSNILAQKGFDKQTLFQLIFISNASD
jgi:hypothetical protein